MVFVHADMVDKYGSHVHHYLYDSFRPFLTRRMHVSFENAKESAATKAPQDALKNDDIESQQPSAPQVIKTGSAVIIKPGDNLWRISRKTYGRGIRYTTIYNANRDQIRDPNRIYIGQIFKIPEKAEQ